MTALPERATVDRATPRVPAATTRRRWWWLSGLGVVGLGLVGAAWWQLPRWVEATLRSRLQQAGFTTVAIGAVEVGFDRLVVRGLRLEAAPLGTGHVTIAAATAAFTVADLFARRIDSLVLDHPVWTMGPASATDARAAAGTLLRDEPGAPGLPAQALPVLPLRRLALRGGRITPRAGSALGAVSIEATLAIVDERWLLELAAVADRQRVTASVQLPSSAPDRMSPAVGTVELCVHGTQPLELSGTCELAAMPAGRSLRLDLQRRPGSFEVVVAGTTCSGEGTLELHASVPFDALDAAVVAARCVDLELASAAGMQLHGLAADVHLRGLPVPVSVGPQQVTWRRALLAGVPLGSGEATLALLPGAELGLRLRQRTVDEVGSVEIRELRWAPGLRSAPVTMVFEQVPLRGGLELLSRGRITGEGRLSGSLELVAQIEPRPAVDLRGGRLVAAPGGFVRFLDDADTETMLRQHTAQIALASGHEALVQERLVAALREFAYTALEFAIDAAGEDVTLRVHAAGVGRKVPQQLRLDVNLHGFDAAVDAALAVKFRLDRMQQNFTDTIDNQPPARREQRKP